MFEFKESISLQDFDNFASNHEMSSINQSIYWPKIKNNWKPYYTGLYQDNQLVGVALVLIRKVLGFKFAYIPRGPLMDYENREIVRQMMQGLTEFAKKNRYLFVRMDPNINYRIFKLADKETAPILESGKTAIKNLLQAKTKHLGFPTKMSDGFQPRFVAITHHTDDYMVDLPKSTRKSIRDADKLGVKTRLATVDEVDKFVSVLNKTESRKNIQLRSKPYFELMLNTFGDKAILMLAEIDLKANIQEFESELKDLLQVLPEKPPKKAAQLQQRINALQRNVDELTPYVQRGEEKKVLSGGLSILYGNTIEHIYAGFDIEFKRYRPQYKLTVARMQYGFERGLKYSNLGGIEGTLDDGLTEFKSNFNPYIHEYIGEFDIPVSPLYPLFRLAWKIREKRRQ